MSFQIATVSSGRPRQDYYTYNQFFESLANFGHQPVVLGGEPGAFRGLGSKPKLLRKAILDGTISADELIFCDSWDLVFAQSPEGVMDDFHNKFSTRWVSSAEKNCFPTGEWCGRFPACNSSYRFLNSGFIVASTEAMLMVLNHMKLDEQPDDHPNPDGTVYHANDQFWFMEAFLAQPIPMQLDTGCMISQTMHAVELPELDFSGPLIRNRETNQFPCSFHFNGGSKTSGVREPILKHLGL